MDIHKLEVFIDLSETLNYTETAERQFTSQGNVSKQIISLEKELDTKLFTRSHKKIELTEVGRLSLTYVQTIVDQYHQMKNKLVDLRTGSETILHISTIPTLIKYEGFTTIMSFLNKHPETTLQLREAETDALVAVLEHGENRLVFSRFFEWNHPDTEVLITEEDEFVAVFTKDHPLAKKSELSLKELEHERFLLLRETSQLKQPVIDLCHQAGFDPSIANVSSRIDLLIQMAKENLGIAILMSKTFKLNPEDHLVALPITPNVKSKLAFIKRKNDTSMIVNEFWDYLKEQQ